jgi:ribosomal protein S18 acetylase RimI-like enzyme
LVQFVAIVDQHYYPKTHGVVGVVDVHRKPNSALLELKNLRVHETGRRQGIASALVEAVQEYARKISGAVYLNYDQDNEAAIRLYLSRGFQLDPKEELKMIWTV